MIRALFRNGGGVIVAGVIVAVNFAFALQLTGLSYGRFQWTAFTVSYVPTTTPTSTPTATPTSTATSTPTPLPDGSSCTDGAACASTFCVDGVCCDRECDQPDERCNVAGREGTCIAAAPAPVLPGEWLFAAILLLVAIGTLSIRSLRSLMGGTS